MRLLNPWSRSAVPNAFTSTEYTCYYARCLDSELHTALDVLSDMVMNPVFPMDEIEKEKGGNRRDENVP